MLTFLKYVEWYFAKAKSTGFSHPVIQPSYYMYMGVYGLWVQSVACLFWGVDTSMEDTRTTDDEDSVDCVPWQRDTGSGEGAVGMCQRQTSPIWGESYSEGIRNE